MVWRPAAAAVVGQIWASCPLLRWVGRTCRPVVTAAVFVQDRASRPRSASPSMPRFSANLGHLFAEYPLIERIGAAAKAGFKAIELQLPYELAPSAVKAEIDRHRPHDAQHQFAAGARRRAGARGGRRAARRNSRRCSPRRSTTWWRSAARRSTCCRASCRRNERPAAEKVIVANLARACDEAAAKNIFLMLEPLNQRDRPGLFRLAHRAHRRHHRQGRQAEPEDHVRLLPCAGDAG